MSHELYCHKCQKATEVKNNSCSGCQGFYADCRIYHYGNQELIRECCVAECIYWHRLARKVALTGHHPTYTKATDVWNSLTDAEMRQVMDTLEGEMPIIRADEVYAKEQGWEVGHRMYPSILGGL